MVGPALATIPALLISLLLPDPFPRTIWIILYFVCIQMLESNILGPRIVGHAVGLHPIAAILCLIIGVQLFGAFGALLATPIVAAAWVVTVSLYNSAKGKTADQILEHKRKPIVIRPPGVFLPRRKKVNTHKLEDHPGENTRTVDAGEGAEKPTPSMKRSSLQPEHIDLLRPVPDIKSPLSESSEEETES